MHQEPRLTMKTRLEEINGLTSRIMNYVFLNQFDGAASAVDFTNATIIAVHCPYKLLTVTVLRS